MDYFFISVGPLVINLSTDLAYRHNHLLSINVLTRTPLHEPPVVVWATVQKLLLNHLLHSSKDSPYHQLAPKTHLIWFQSRPYYLRALLSGIF